MEPISLFEYKTLILTIKKLSRHPASKEEGDGLEVFLSS